MQTSGRQAFDGRGESADQVTTSIYRAVLAEQTDWTIDLVPKTLGGARDYLADGCLRVAWGGETLGAGTAPRLEPAGQRECRSSVGGPNGIAGSRFVGKRRIADVAELAKFLLLRCARRAAGH